MLLVSGTKRSGTSMWMQALVAGGFPYIGTPFSGTWEESIGEANPRGFYESLLRQGVFFATNPHPQTGAFLRPETVKHHAVKVFIPGLVRSDYAYLHRVIATMRDWRSYGPSLARLYAMEDDWIRAQPDGEERLPKALAMRSTLPAHVDWFFENYELVRDIAVRRYPVNLTSYDAMLRDPEALITRVFGWIGEGDVTAALKAIEPSLRTQTGRDELPVDVDPEHAALFDELYDTVDSGRALGGPLLARMNALQIALVEQHGALNPERERQSADDFEA